MSYAILISPPERIKNKIIHISRNIVQKVYSKEVDSILYRVKSRPKNNEPRKLFIQGNGKVYEFDLPPHSSLLKPFDTDCDSEEIIFKTKDIAGQFSPFKTKTVKVADHGEPFTFFLQLEATEAFFQLENKLFKRLHPFFPKRKHLKFRPHITLLYDDANYELAKKARGLVDEEKLVNKEFEIDSFSLYKLKGPNLEKIHTFDL